jgi:integrase
VFGKKMICEISNEDIVNYRNTLALEASNITANRSLFIIKQVFSHALRFNAIKSDPAALVPYLSEKEHERKEFLMPDGLRELVKASQELRTRFYLPAIIYLGAEHGASKQEILDLHWSDIDFDFADIGLIKLFRTKTKKLRTEFLMPRTKQALIEWSKHQEWMRHRKKITHNGSDLVFCRLDGSSIKGFDKSWRKIRKMAGFERLHFHDLRHTFCSNLLLSGSDLKDVKEMIGHRDLSMTDRYSHLTISRKLLRQEELARFYASDNGVLRPSGEHIG